MLIQKLINTTVRKYQRKDYMNMIRCTRLSSCRGTEFSALLYSEVVLVIFHMSCPPYIIIMRVLISTQPSPKPKVAKIINNVLFEMKEKNQVKHRIDAHFI